MLKKSPCDFRGGERREVAKVSKEESEKFKKRRRAWGCRNLLRVSISIWKIVVFDLVG
jgi:hypothetical protein